MATGDPAPPDQTAPLVLVVEDDLPLARLMEALLESAGYRVRRAGDGQSALETIHAARPALVLLDLTLPKLDGWGVLERLRPDEQAPPVILLTGDARAGRQAEEAGAAATILKPFDIDELLATIEQLLAERRC